MLVISDDLDEVLTLGDRIAVMHSGHLTEARPAEDWTREAIGLAMAGVQFSDGPPLEKLAPSGGSDVHEVTSVGAISS